MHGLRRRVDLFITWFLWLSWQGEWKLLCSQVWSSFFPLRAWYWFKKLFSLYIENYFGIKYGSEWKGLRFRILKLSTSMTYIKTQLQQIMLLNKKQILLHSTRRKFYSIINMYRIKSHLNLWKVQFIWCLWPPVILFDKYKIVDKLFQIKSVLYYIKMINYLSTLNCKKHAKAKFAKTMPCQYTFLSFALRIQKLTTAWIGVYHLFCLIYRFEAKLMAYFLDINRWTIRLYF